MTTSVASVRTVGLSPEQVAARRAGIGGSDAAAVLGVDPYKTALTIYQAKVGEREADPPNAAMKRGTYLEPLARKLYRELTGRRVKRLAQVTHPSYPFMLCNVDGLIVANRKRNGQDGPGVLELKCPGVWAFAKVKREGLPMHWLVQMQHNLQVTGFGWGSFALFNADLWEMIHFDVMADLELAHALVIKEQQFWLQHVGPRVPPPEPEPNADLVEQLAKAQGATTGELILRNDAEWGEAARMYSEAKEIAETGENLLSSAKEKLKALMAQKGAVEGAGLRCYWSERDGKTSFDRKALEATKPLDAIAVATGINDLLMNDDLKTKIIAGLEGCRVDFKRFEKVGKPFEDFRCYIVKAGIGD